MAAEPLHYIELVLQCGVANSSSDTIHQRIYTPPLGRDFSAEWLFAASTADHEAAAAQYAGYTAISAVIWRSDTGTGAPGSRVHLRADLASLWGSLRRLQVNVQAPPAPAPAEATSAAASAAASSGKNAFAALMAASAPKGRTVGDDGAVKWALSASEVGSRAAAEFQIPHHTRSAFVFFGRRSGLLDAGGQGTAAFPTQGQRNTASRALWHAAEAYSRLYLKRPAMEADGMPRACKWPKLLVPLTPCGK
jgi:hypothetical protein